MTLRNVQKIENLQYRFFENWPVRRNTRLYTLTEILYIQRLEQMYSIESYTN